MVSQDTQSVTPGTPPKRIQLRRTRGWRKPEGAIVVSRPSRWGNPYVLHSEEIVIDLINHRDWWIPGGGREFAVKMFHDEILIGGGIPHPNYLSRKSEEDIRRDLAGRDLCCWCRLDWPCHADILLEIANA